MQDIFSRMLEKIDDRFEKTKGNFFFDVLKPVAMEIEKLLGKHDNAIEKLNVDNLIGKELDMYIGDRTPLKRRQGNHASGYVTFYGREGAEIPVGSIVSAGDLYFSTQKYAVIPPEEEVDVLVKCEVKGNVGNVGSYEINETPVAIRGVEEVENKQQFTNGYDDESDEDFLERYKIYKNKPITSNNVFHYELWALSVEGVGGVKVIPTWNGPNSVKIIVMDSNNKPAGTDLINRVQEYIDPKEHWGQGRGMASAGAFVTVESARTKQVDIQANVKLRNIEEMDKVIEDFKERLEKHLSSISFIEEGGEVKVSEVGAILLGTDGVLDYNNLTLNGEQKNIYISDEEIVAVGEVVFNELS